MKKFAIILSGSGVYDGAEIHEAVFTMLAIDKLGHKYELFAPNIKQLHVVNHLTGEAMDNEERNVLVESARIARGKIKALEELKSDRFDAIVFPGGFGVAKNLSSFAFEGAAAKINKDVERLVKEFAAAKKPIGALCIAPAMVSLIIEGVTVTIGNDSGTIEQIKKAKGEHKITTHGEVVHDHTHNVFSTPCYMLDASISEIANGAENLIKEMIQRGIK